VRLGAGIAELRFFGEVNDFFGPDNREARITCPVDRRASIKDVVEALGVPHTEVGRIVVDGQEVDFHHLLRSGETVLILAHEVPVRVDRPTTLRPRPYPGHRFIVDVNVGRLAGYLRLLGFDTAYEHGWRDETISARAHSEKRVVLTRDRDLLKRSIVEHGRLIRAERPKEQLAEVLRIYGLEEPYALFSRCLRCNGALQPVPKEKILQRLEPKTRRYFQRFHICPQCERIYWRGSHHQRMVEELQRLGIDTGARR
jgi:uncharacterized protein